MRAALLRQCSYASPREAMGWLAYNAARGPSLVTVVVFVIPAMVLLAGEEEDADGRVWGGAVRAERSSPTAWPTDREVVVFRRRLSRLNILLNTVNNTLQHTMERPVAAVPRRPAADAAVATRRARCQSLLCAKRSGEHTGGSSVPRGRSPGAGESC